MKIGFTRCLLVLMTLLTLSGCAALLTPKVQSNFSALKGGDYVLDKTHATVLFKIDHLGLSTYLGRFNQFDANLSFDPANMAAATLSALIDMGSVDVNNESLEEELRTKQWFHTEVYPQAQFTSSSVRPISDSEFEFIGQLEWRGVSKPVTVAAKFNGGAFNMLTQKYTLGFNATTSFNRSDFGMDAYLPLVGDKVDIEVYVEFQKR